MQAGKGMSPFVAPQKHVKKVPISTAPAASSNFGKSMKYKWANVVYKKSFTLVNCQVTELRSVVDRVESKL
tara:strand:+ start:791 stop:1003 length:213 start_codon:yes stop_codon:yes gene_type:complete